MWTRFINLAVCKQDGRAGIARSWSGCGDCNGYNTIVLCVCLRWAWQDVNWPLGHTHYHYTIYAKIVIFINLPHIYISVLDI